MRRAGTSVQTRSDAIAPILNHWRAGLLGRVIVMDALGKDMLRARHLEAAAAGRQEGMPPCSHRVSR